MAIEYLGLSEINGPLVVLEGVQDAAFDEIVEFKVDDGTKKIGRIVEIYEDKAVIHVSVKYPYKIDRTPDGSRIISGHPWANF